MVVLLWGRYMYNAGEGGEMSVGLVRLGCVEAAMIAGMDLKLRIRDPTSPPMKHWGSGGQRGNHTEKCCAPACLVRKLRGIQGRQFVKVAGALRLEEHLFIPGPAAAADPAPWLRGKALVVREDFT